MSQDLSEDSGQDLQTGCVDIRDTTVTYPVPNGCFEASDVL